MHEISKLLTEHHLEFLSLKGGCRSSSESICQNATLLEITCTGSLIISGGAGGGAGGPMGAMMNPAMMGGLAQMMGEFGGMAALGGM